MLFADGNTAYVAHPQRAEQSKNAKKKSKKQLKKEQANMQSDNIEMGEWNTDEMISNGIQMSGPVMTTTPVMTTSTVDTFDAGFSYSYDDIGQLDLFDEMDMREKYPALNQAYEHYQSVLEICKTKEKEDNED